MSNLELNTNQSADNSKWPRKAIVIGLTLAGFAATAGVIAFAALPKRGVQPDTKPAIPALNVTRTESHRESWSATVEVPGAVAPWQEAVLSAQVAGLRLLEVNAEVGDTVHRGQVVARFDTEMLKADEAQLTAELTKAEANAHSCSKQAAA